MPLGCWSGGPDWSLHSLHGEIDLHLICSLRRMPYLRIVENALTQVLGGIVLPNQSYALELNSHTRVTMARQICSRSWFHRIRPTEQLQFFEYTNWEFVDLSQNLGINYSFVNSSMPLRAVCSLQNFLVICLASTKIISFGRSHAHSQTATSSTTILIFDKSPPGPKCCEHLLQRNT